MINGSFFGSSTAMTAVSFNASWTGCKYGYHHLDVSIATPYPGTDFYKEMKNAGRLTTSNWDLFDTRHTVFQPAKMSPDELEEAIIVATAIFTRGVPLSNQAFFTAVSNISSNTFFIPALGRSLNHCGMRPFN